jgi:hypothetical protein
MRSDRAYVDSTRSPVARAAAHAGPHSAYSTKAGVWPYIVSKLCICYVTSHILEATPSSVRKVVPVMKVEPSSRYIESDLKVMR